MGCQRLRVRILTIGIAQATPPPVEFVSAMSTKPALLVASMLAAVAVVGLLACWDDARESQAALDAFAESQGLLARSVAAELGAQLASSPTPALFEGAARLERPNALEIRFLPPGSGELLTTDGRRVRLDVLVHALEGDGVSLRLSRAEAEQASLPARTAFAGLAHVADPAGGRWGVAVIASAQRERDRENRARNRLLLAVALAAALVLTFGGLALRTLRREMALAGQLAVAEVERDRDERLARLSRAATTLTLASGMAHELSTPLGIIVGRAEQLEPRLASDERGAHAVRTILEQARRISEIIRGFIHLARGGAPALRSADPQAIVEGALALVAHRFSQRGVGVQAQLPPGLPPIPCDERLLEQALINLLLNACDACAAGDSVQVGAQVDATGVCFTVTDNGSGISPEHAARLAEPFFTTKPAGAGTGLGLAVTNEIMKSHRGSLTIEAAVPRGTCARLQIPFSVGGPDARA
jgi:two-component system NtrC family sensor kinase